MSSTLNFEVYVRPTTYWLAVPLGNYYLAIWGTRIKNMKTIFPTTATARIMRGSYTKVAEKVRNGYVTVGAFSLDSYVCAGAFSLEDLGPLVLEEVEAAAKVAEKLGLNPEVVRAASAFGNDNPNDNSFKPVFPASPITEVTMSLWNI